MSVGSHPPAARTPEFPPAVLSICAADAQHRTSVRHVGPTGVYVVGRAAGCDIVIADPAVSRRHICLQAHAGYLHMTAYPDARPAFVNGRECGDRGLAHGDIIRLGDTLLTVIYPPLDGTTTREPKSAGPSRRPLSRPDVARGVLVLAGRHGENLHKLQRGALDRELGEYLGLSAVRARKLLDQLAVELGVGDDVKRTERYVTVVDRLRRVRAAHGASRAHPR